MLSEELSRVVLPIVQFDGLSLEAVDPAAVAPFWASALQGSVRDLGDGRVQVDSGPHRPPKEFIRVRPGEPGPDPGRVHVDVRLSREDPRDLLAAGARVVRPPGDDPWYVLADPLGNEFCAFPAVDDRPAGIFELVVKCRDAHALARWWGVVLGGEVTPEGAAAVVVGAPDFPWDFMVFDPVPEAKTGPNRLHWHVVLRDPEPSSLVSLGATVLGRGEYGWVLADPEGNEFCASTPLTVPAQRR